MTRISGLASGAGFFCRWLVALRWSAPGRYFSDGEEEEEGKSQARTLPSEVSDSEARAASLLLRGDTDADLVCRGAQVATQSLALSEVWDTMKKKKPNPATECLEKLIAHFHLFDLIAIGSHKKKGFPVKWRLRK